MAKRNNGEGTLRKRKDGRWEGRITVSYKEDGKPVYKSVFAKTKGECSDKLKKLIQEHREAQLILNRCAFLDNADPTLEEWYEIWMESFCKASVKEYTAKGYAQYFKVKILPKIGNIKIKNISTVVCQQFLMDMYKNGRIRNVNEKGNALSSKTVKDIKIALQVCLQKAVDEGLIRDNPCSKVQLPKDEPKEMKTLKSSEIAAFLEEAKDSNCYEFYFLEITTGLRLGEILALTWDDLDIKNKTITVNKQVQRIGKELRITTPKTKASIRKISICDECLSQLLVLRSRQRIDTRLMFPSPITEKYRDPSSVTRKLHRMQKRAGIPQIRFHDLRHSFATLSLEQGMDIKTVSHMLGHTDAGFTMNTYMHVTDKMQQTVASAMGNLISEKENEKRNKIIQYTA
ncbi:MAG: tyrosine-type recombinase/integrase [Clostridiales bacterium]|nr:tyrosine-type recombinase/integrase [Clostridiales bacterium]